MNILQVVLIYGLLIKAVMGLILYQLTHDGYSQTGITHDATTDLGAGSGGVAGGLFVCNNFYYRYNIQ